MADRLTQLQDCLDDLITQMYASLDYIYTRHPYGNIPGQVSQASASHQEPQSSATNGDGPKRTNGEQTEQQKSRANDDNSTAPEAPAAFTSNLGTFAQDLIVKEQQIEYIVRMLPGLGNSQTKQETKMKELEEELKLVEDERRRKEEEREIMVGLLAEVIGKVKRVG